MSERKKRSLSEKEAKLVKAIEKAKAELAKLNEKKIKTLGKLAIKHGLDQFDMETVDRSFLKLSEELKHGYKQTS